MVRLLFFLWIIATVVLPHPWTTRAYAVTANAAFASKFEKQAAEHFPGLTIAEQTLLRAVEAGDAAVCFPGGRPPESKNPAKGSALCSAIETVESDPYSLDQRYPGILSGPKFFYQEASVRADLIRWLCSNHNAAEHIDPRGIRLYGVTIRGRLDISFLNIAFPLVLDYCAIPDGIRAVGAHLRRLELTGTHTSGIEAQRAVVEDGIFLNDGFVADGTVYLGGDNINGVLDCAGGSFHDSQAPSVDSEQEPYSAFSYSTRSQSRRTLALDLSGIKASDVFMGDPAADTKGLPKLFFKAMGQVRLVEANISGDLDMTGATISVFPNGRRSDVPEGPKGYALDESKIALDASALTVRRLWLRNGFRADGAISLVNAKVGELDLIAGDVRNHCDIAIYADRVEIANGARFGYVDGVVLLDDAAIGADLDLSYAHIMAGRCFPRWDEFSGVLFANSTHVSGTVAISSHFVTDATLFFPSADVDKDFEVDKDFDALEGATFSGRPTQNGIIAQALSVKHNFAWKSVRHDNATMLNLDGASIGGAFQTDDTSRLKNRLHITGLTYGALEIDHTKILGKTLTYSPFTTDDYIGWLTLIPVFNPQPYRELANFLQGTGDDDGARRVLVAMEDRRLHEENIGLPEWLTVSNVFNAFAFGFMVLAVFFKRWLPQGWRRGRLLSTVVGVWLLAFLANSFLAWNRVFGVVLRDLIGYGYYPLLALGWSLLVVLLGWVIVSVAQSANVMKSTNTEDEHEPLSPFLYSLNVFLPVVDLHQEKHWWPDSKITGSFQMLGHSFKIRGAIVRRYLWFQIIAGWLLSGLFLAGISGLIKSH